MFTKIFENVIRYAPYWKGKPEEYYVEFEQGTNQIMVWVVLTGESLVLGPYFAQGGLVKRIPTNN